MFVLAVGGYSIEEHLFYPHQPAYEQQDKDACVETIPVLVYIADSSSPHWLGEDTLPNIARQVVDCRGPCGENSEYLLRLANFMHDVLPEVYDEHLFELEKLVLKELRRRKAAKSNNRLNRQSTTTGSRNGVKNSGSVDGNKSCNVENNVNNRKRGALKIQDSVDNQVAKRKKGRQDI